MTSTDERERAAIPRTLWVTNDFPPRAGGIEQFIANLCDHLDPAGVRVVTGSSPDGAKAAAEDADRAYPVERLPRRVLLPDPGVLRAVRSAAARHEAQVVVLGSSWPLGWLAGQLVQPTFALSHGHEAGMARVGLGWLLRPGLRRLDGLGTVSGYSRRTLAPAAPAGVAIHDVWPGVDTERFNPAVEGSHVRQRFGVRDDQPLVVCVSRLVRRKGQDVLVEAWPAVRERIAGAQLLLVGTGPLSGHLERRVRRHGLSDSVHLAGEVPAQELPAVLAAADVFAMPARTRWAGLDVEGLGIVYLEAQASGVPVVAGKSGGAPETVCAGQTGLVVDGTEWREVADAVAGLLADPERRAAMGRAGRHHVSQDWSWPAVAERFAGILWRLAGDAA